MNYKTIRTGISKNLVFIISMMILGVVIIIVYAPFGESEPQTSLLSYSCEELENKHISTDGPGGKFVIDQASFRWVDKSLIKRAKQFKNCETARNDMEYDFYYKNNE